VCVRTCGRGDAQFRAMWSCSVPFFDLRRGFPARDFLKGLSKQVRWRSGGAGCGTSEDGHLSEGSPAVGQISRSSVKSRFGAEKCPNRRGVEAILAAFQGGSVVPFAEVSAMQARGQGVGALHRRGFRRSVAGTWITDKQAWFWKKKSSHADRAGSVRPRQCPGELGHPPLPAMKLRGKRTATLSITRGGAGQCAWVSSPPGRAGPMGRWSSSAGAARNSATRRRLRQGNWREVIVVFRNRWRWTILENLE